MAGEFIKGTTIKPAIPGTIANPDDYNQNLAGQSKDSILGIDANGDFVDFTIGDESKGSNGSLASNLKLREGAVVKFYNSSGVLINQTGFSKLGKNLIINGDFEIAARGTSFVSLADSTYTLDRWGYYKGGAMVHNVSQDSDVPTFAQAGRLITNSLLVDCTTPDTSIDAGEYCFIAQRIEGYNFKAIAQKKFILSFWVKATKTGTYCVGFRNGGIDRSFIGEYTVDASDTWEFKTIIVDASPSAGTWNYINGNGLEVAFALAVGSSYQGSAETWLTGVYSGSSNQVNACDSASNNFRLAGVQLEVGEIATEFEKRNIAIELELCQRFFARLGSGSSLYTGWGSGVIESANTAFCFIKYPTQMRSPPSITQSNTTIWAGAIGLPVTALGVGYFGLDSLAINIIMGGGGATLGRGAVWCGNNTSSAYIDLNSEL